MNVSRKNKETCICDRVLPWTCSNLLGGGGDFGILNPKSAKKCIRRQNVVKVKYPYITCKKYLWRHLLFNFLKNVNFSSSYKGLSANQIWFNLGQGKPSYERGVDSANPPQVENVLNRPGSTRWNAYNLVFIASIWYQSNIIFRLWMLSLNVKLIYLFFVSATIQAHDEHIFVFLVSQNLNCSHYVFKWYLK